ncbi:quinoprotein dehydrogenase-associated probable ABC transporter substrate-binding protein [Modicisalibacter ilicicola DSM 19980]|uniref:Quinoprotein dehydrogenase-associated probable ABC transporter substrate-binding protein n=1 Tax=Modicisalibacter ilicicola DSM 19980 TaxID=1121942 RepID=A0A1M5AYH7_9GAMM|nr:quinoprotein dehydrogenase-associated putative ABC transporter substrate-binding protein [Halomonas ilicicola]SHF35288.1 quinoprotein dehydrogenase-associated probable ABC transporter substrate-binding protein [Halomonas ilicicola DSM 19980]
MRRIDTWSRGRWRTIVAGAFGLIASIAVADLPERESREHLRVCADANNLPFTNRQGEGFENRIAEMIAAELDVPLRYVHAPQVMGFIRNTLDARLCDLVMGVAAGYEFVQNTLPYYRSVYSLVVPKGSDLEATHLEAATLEGKQIGVIFETPPTVPLRRAGAHLQSYALQTDTRVRTPARDAVEDVAKGVTDGAVIWGPLAGYYAARQNPPLAVVPLVDDTSQARLIYAITMGVRHGEPQWRDWLNDFIRRRQADIDALLVDYHVPLLDEHGRLMSPAATSGEARRD